MTFTITACGVGWALAVAGWGFIGACVYGTYRGWFDEDD